MIFEKLRNIRDYNYKELKFVLERMGNLEKQRKEVPIDYFSSIQLAISSGVEKFYDEVWMKSNLIYKNCNEYRYNRNN